MIFNHQRAFDATSGGEKSVVTEKLRDHNSFTTREKGPIHG